MEATREQTQIMVCVCRLKTGDTTYDSCSAITSGPDEPVCSSCVTSGHPEQAIFDPIVKGDIRA